MICEFLVNLGSFLINRLIKGMTRSFETLVEVQQWDILYKANPHNTAKFCHFAKTWIVDVEPKGINQVPFPEDMIKRVKYSANKESLFKKKTIFFE